MSNVLPVAKASQPRNSSFSFVTTFCNFYSYFLIFPFKLTWSPNSAKYTLQSSRIRKILCCISHTISALTSLLYLVGIFYPALQGWRYMNMVIGIVHAACFLTTYDLLHTMWNKQDLILAAANWHIHMNIHYNIPYFKIGFCCLFPFAYIGLNNPLAEIYNENIELYHNNQFAYTSFFNLDKLLADPYHFLLYMTLSYGQLYYLVSTGLILTLALSIRESVMQLKTQNNCRHYQADDALHMGLQMETDIRTLIATTNKIIHNKILLEYLMVLAWYTTILEIFGSSFSSFYQQLHVVSYLLYSGAFWACACEIHCLVKDHVTGWVQWYRSTYVQNSPQSLIQFKTCLLSLQTEVQVNPASISCRCFKVTYGFIGSMFGLIITYSTIVDQMKLDRALF